MAFDKNQKDHIVSKLAQAGSDNFAEAAVAQREIAEAVEVPLRETLLSGDIVKGIYTIEDYSGTNSEVRYPLDLLTPGQEREYYAYVIPSHGEIPQRRVDGDYLMIPTYEIGNSIDCTLRLLKEANWNVLARMMQILEAGFVKKLNDDGWQTIISAAVDRNILVYDPNAAAGQFTPRLITLMRTFMRRNGGGNSSTLGRASLTDLYVSPEAMDDIRAWNLELVPDPVRSNIYYSPDDGNEMVKVYGVNLHPLDELGEGQEYQNFFTTTLGGSMAASDQEIAVGLDLSKNDSFVHPVKEPLKIFEDNTTHRKRIFSLYGWTTIGFAVLDSRRCILGSF